MEPRIEPTPETKAKLPDDQLERLYATGDLSREHLDAAAEIRSVWEAFGRGLFPDASRQDKVVQKHRLVMQRDPIDGMTPAEEKAWRLRYRPWANEMGSELAAGVVRVTRLQLTIDVVVENTPLIQIESWYRLREGNGLVYLKASLDRYARIAGWL